MEQQFSLVIKDPDSLHLSLCHQCLGDEPQRGREVAATAGGVTAREAGKGGVGSVGFCMWLFYPEGKLFPGNPP